MKKRLDIACDVRVENQHWKSALKGGNGVASGFTMARRAVKTTLRHALPGHGGALTVALCFSNNNNVQALNKQYLQKDYPTNVLSFPSFAAADLPEALRVQSVHLGDIILAYGVCAEQAAGIGRNFGMHTVHLVVHGVLHLLGYDHMTAHDRQHSEATERAIMASLNFPDPYPDEEDPLHAHA